MRVHPETSVPTPCQVVFGCGNDRFGGCGSILSVHQEGWQVRMKPSCTPRPCCIPAAAGPCCRSVPAARDPRLRGMSRQQHIVGSRVQGTARGSRDLVRRAVQMAVSRGSWHPAIQCAKACMHSRPWVCCRHSTPQATLQVKRGLLPSRLLQGHTYSSCMCAAAWLQHPSPSGQCPEEHPLLRLPSPNIAWAHSRQQL